MAKKCVEARNKKRKKLVAIMRDTVIALRKAVRTGSDEEKEAAAKKLNNMRRDSRSVRVRNRCTCCGRPRGVMRRFKMCRICVREAAARGDIPGLKKASW
mgnify:CR=1 FL=1